MCRYLTINAQRRLPLLIIVHRSIILRRIKTPVLPVRISAHPVVQHNIVNSIERIGSEFGCAPHGGVGHPIAVQPEHFRLVSINQIDPLRVHHFINVLGKIRHKGMEPFEQTEIHTSMQTGRSCCLHDLTQQVAVRANVD